MTSKPDSVFTNSIPEFYDTFLTPLIFEPYAEDLARRVGAAPVSNVLEVAAGTGVVTRAMVESLDHEVAIAATDLNQQMLDHGQKMCADPRVTWQQANAQELPFESQCFDAVVCQFAAMFFPDRVKAYSEALRVLKPGGYFYFNVWDAIEENEFADTVTKSLVDLFPNDPPRFLARTPHGYHDIDNIIAEIRAGGFEADTKVKTITAQSVAADPSIPAIAYCQGTPLRSEIENRDAGILAHATETATIAIRDKFGEGVVEGKMQAHIFSVQA